MSEPSASAWCVNTRQIRRLKRRGILRAMLILGGVRWVTSSERAGRSKKKILLLDADLRHDPSTLIFERGFPFAGQSRNEGLGRIGKRRKRFPAFFCTRFDDMGCSKLSKEGSPRASFARRRGLPKAGS